MLIPKKTKYKKVQKGTLPNKVRAEADKKVFGIFALKSLDFGIITSKQLEAARKVIAKKIKKKGKLWVRVFAHTPKTKKPIEVRMGKGKGSVDTWVLKVKPGTILYEIEGLPYKMSYDIFFSCSHKLPVKCQII